MAQGNANSTHGLVLGNGATCPLTSADPRRRAVPQFRSAGIDWLTTCTTWSWSELFGQVLGDAPSQGGAQVHSRSIRRRIVTALECAAPPVCRSCRITVASAKTLAQLGCSSARRCPRKGSILSCDIRVVPVESAARERLLTVLDEYALGVGHPFQTEDVLIEAWNGETWLGALMGHINQGWFFVSLLGVTPAARGRGVGRQLIQKAEVLARERALVGLWLDTFSWQAPGFYRRLGFTEVGRIPDHPPGEVRLFLTKRLDVCPTS